ncbi:MAG: hypothetical protein IPN29_18790 [Saprospiraceae bacterium]|nr:hypothetical protein [Saprospiraceae bacterium]
MTSLVAVNWQCSPKVAPNETPPVVVSENPPKPEVTNPCKMFSDLPGLEREKAETAFVLYKDQLKINNYTAALPIWKQAYTLAPGSNGRVKGHFDDGVAIYSHLVTMTADSAKKRLFVDTIRMIQNKRQECFGADASYIGQKAFDYYYRLYGLVPEVEIYNTFKKAIDMGNGKMDYYIINPFTKLLYDRVQNGTETVEEGSKYALLVTKAITDGLATCKGEQCETWKIINEYAPDLLEGLEGVDGFYTCEYYAAKYHALFKATPDDCEVVNKAYRQMVRGGCPNDDARLKEVFAVKNSKCFVAPPAPGTLTQAYEAYSKGQYNTAIKLFDKYVDVEAPDKEKKAKYLMLISNIYYVDVKNFPKSRQYAYEAAKQRPGWGEPYMVIGKLYASSGPLCGPGRGWDSQIVTWPAIDKWEYAKSIDGSVASEANTLINRYKAYMPNREDIHQRSLLAGSNFFVPCWIKENTKIRTSD